MDFYILMYGDDIPIHIYTPVCIHVFFCCCMGLLFMGCYVWLAKYGLLSIAFLLSLVKSVLLTGASSIWCMDL